MEQPFSDLDLERDILPGEAKVLRMENEVNTVQPRSSKTGAEILGLVLPVRLCHKLVFEHEVEEGALQSLFRGWYCGAWQVADIFVRYGTVGGVGGLSLGFGIAELEQLNLMKWRRWTSCSFSHLEDMRLEEEDFAKYLVFATTNFKINTQRLDYRDTLGGK